jgi:hypothetical protein
VVVRAHDVAVDERGRLLRSPFGHEPQDLAVLVPGLLAPRHQPARACQPRHRGLDRVGEEVVAGERGEPHVEVRAGAHRLVGRAPWADRVQVARQGRDLGVRRALAAEPDGGGLHRTPQLAEACDLAEVDGGDLPRAAVAAHQSVGLQPHECRAQRGAGGAQFRFEAALGETGAGHPVEVEDLRAQAVVYARRLVGGLGL